MTDQNALLDVQNLTTVFKTDEGMVRAVNGVSFFLGKKETLGIVGESGCGKSVTNLSLLGLIPSPPGKITAGNVYFNGRDILNLPENEKRKIRGRDIAMIFQDPMTSLNPFLRISTQMTEAPMLHFGWDKKKALDRAVEMLALVGIPDAGSRVHEYPHEFSGGMRQRVMIAMALATSPKLLIADEPTTALDVTIQAQILELLKELKEKLGMSLILITHNIGVVAGMADRVMVMYAGYVVEENETRALFQKPKHPYTAALLNSVPSIGEETRKDLYSIPGAPPNLADLPDACPFYPRCPRVMDNCRKKMPPLVNMGSGRLACYNPME